MAKNELAPRPYLGLTPISEAAYNSCPLAAHEETPMNPTENPIHEVFPYKVDPEEMQRRYNALFE